MTVTVTSADIDAAAARIAGRIRRTPVLAVDSAATFGVGFFKLEFLQHTGTFKARGAHNRILSVQEQGLLDPAVGVVIASGGNAGLASAYAARELGVPATVFVPTTAPPVKIAGLRGLGAEVVLAGVDYASAYDAARERAEGTGAVYCHAYDQPEIVAGAGTLGRELLEQTDALDTVVVSVGGGGLLAGVAAAVEGVAQVVGVEPDGAPTLSEALRLGGPVDVPVSSVAADSLGARRLGGIAYDVAIRAGVGSVLVTDAAIIDARLRLWREYRIVVEHGAATAFAALTSGVYRPAAGERVAVVLCGANTELADFVDDKGG